MIAVFSLPLFAAWILTDTAVPVRIRTFRIVLTLAAALAMGGMVFLRQHFLDRELIRLLKRSRDSVDNLKNLQDQIIESEKLASIGQLVGGAAHELNNPITAMLGYADLLAGTSLSPDQHALAVKIGQHVRRTKSLVGSLLSFAKQTPAAKAPIDLNTLVRTALKLSQPQFQPAHVEVRTALEAGLPAVTGDSNQLLQVCLQIVSDAVHRLDERTGGTLLVTTLHEKETVVLLVSEDKGQNQAQETLDATGGTSAAGDSPTGPGLSACHGIVQDHQGRLLWNLESGYATVRVELPFSNSSGRTTIPSGVPLLAESQPFV
jgi:two-component system NtrC family sensor kinase